MTTRRGFLTSILALSAAPAIVRAESLMRIVVPSREIIVPFTKVGAHTIITSGLAIGDVITISGHYNQHNPAMPQKFLVTATDNIGGYSLIPDL